jgi:hypothetical protein
VAQTPDSSASGLLSAADFLSRADARVVGDLVSQDGARVDPTALLTNPVLAACLLDAQGELEAACQRGLRYSPADLAALTGAGKAKLYRVLRDLTLLKLFGLRHQGPPAGYAEVEEELEQLGDGEKVFGLTESAAAGIMSHAALTAADVAAANLLSHRANRLFGPGH